MIASDDYSLIRCQVGVPRRMETYEVSHHLWKLRPGEISDVASSNIASTQSVADYQTYSTSSFRELRSRRRRSAKMTLEITDYRDVVDQHLWFKPGVPGYLGDTQGPPRSMPELDAQYREIKQSWCASE